MARVRKISIIFIGVIAPQSEDAGQRPVISQYWIVYDLNTSQQQKSTPTFN